MGASNWPTQSAEALQSFVEGRECLRQYLGSQRGADLERAKNQFCRSRKKRSGVCVSYVLYSSSRQRTARFGCRHQVAGKACKKKSRLPGGNLSSPCVRAHQEVRGPALLCSRSGIGRGAEAGDGIGASSDSSDCPGVQHVPVLRDGGKVKGT